MNEWPEPVTKNRELLRPRGSLTDSGAAFCAPVLLLESLVCRWGLEYKIVSLIVFMYNNQPPPTITLFGLTFKTKVTQAICIGHASIRHTRACAITPEIEKPAHSNRLVYCSLLRSYLLAIMFINRFSVHTSARGSTLNLSNYYYCIANKIIIGCFPTCFYSCC